MDETRPPSSPPVQPKFGLVIGISIGLGIAIGKTVGSALLPSLGYWGAFGVELVAAAGAAVLVSLLLVRFLR